MISFEKYLLPQKATVTDTPPCPSCGGRGLVVFYSVNGVPVHSVLLMPSPEQARAFPKGDLRLALCPTCGFITNIAFDSSKQNYSTQYEETQGFSGTFNVFHRHLADDLIRRHQLHGKTIIEIGCGKGDFLHLLCDLGGNEGIGFDPAYVPERDAGGSRSGVTFIQDFYSEAYAHYQADFICCKMTLEHIPDVAHLIGTVRRSIGDRKDVVVFFQIPEVRRILRDCAFWDLYYEHCSYFSVGSLARLFRSQGFEVLDLWTDYNDQYLMIDARPADGPVLRPHVAEEDLIDLLTDVDTFITHISDVRSGWRWRLEQARQANRRVALWGGGSKAVAFLTTLSVQDSVAYAVDINPYKKGTFLAGTGHPIIEPDDMAAQPPDIVIIMNPIYRTEIRRDLEARGMHPVMVDIDINPLETPFVS